MQKTLEQWKYPIGRFKYNGEYDEATRTKYLESIGTLPTRLKALTENLTEEQLNKPYRPDGWTVKQLIHHIADSHMNSIIRFKWALSEDHPTIKAYNEKAWAKLYDYRDTPIRVSLQLLEALHLRWIYLMTPFTAEDWKRTVVHPEMQKTISLNEFLALYAWHSEHHLEHIRRAVEDQE